MTSLSGSVWAQFKRALGDYRRWWRVYAGVVAVAALPIAVIILISANADDRSNDVYVSIITLFMAVALIAVAGHQAASSAKPSIRQAYYEGTAPILLYICSFILLFGYAFFALTIGSVRSLIWAWQALGRTYAKRNGLRGTLRTALIVLGVPLTLIIFVLNALLWNLVVLFFSGASLGDLNWVYLCTLLVIFPVFYVLARYIFALYAATVHRVSPFHAVRTSRRLTQQRFWAIFGRLAFLLLFVFAVALVAFLLLLGVGIIVPYYDALIVVFQIIINLVCLPIATIYLLHLYHELYELSASS